MAGLKLIMNKNWWPKTGKELIKGNTYTFDLDTGKMLLGKNIARKEGISIQNLLKKRPKKSRPLARSKDHIEVKDDANDDMGDK